MSPPSWKQREEKSQSKWAGKMVIIMQRLMKGELAQWVEVSELLRKL